jgi:hypothetical protein
MKLIATTAATGCIVTLSLALSPRAPTPDCYVETTVNCNGGCRQWTSGNCGECCRHLDLDMTATNCGGGNVSETCTGKQFFFQAEIRYCPGEPNNDCSYAGKVTCNHYYDGKQASQAACPIQH